MKKLLVVDDSIDIVKELRKTLESDTIEVVAAGNGQEGLDLLTGDTPVDVCICDINMPVMNGLEMLEQYRSSHPESQVPIFMLTTEFDRELRRKGKALGVTGWLVKPFDPERLRTCVSQVLTQ